MSELEDTMENPALTRLVEEVRDLPLTVSDVLANSSDVGAIKIALRLGEDRFYKYIQAFGFGQQTGIELPGETRGLAKPVSRWSKVSIGAISMGQEIGISPLQLVGMVSTIANDGVWVAPRIVATTAAAQRTPQTVVFQPAGERRVLSPITAAQMKQMMQGVVANGKWKQQPGRKIPPREIARIADMVVHFLRLPVAHEMMIG